MPKFFPNPEEYGDVIALSKEIRIEYLLDAYAHGIFPWPMSDMKEIPWFCPEQRAVLFFDQIHLAKSLIKFQKKCINELKWRFSYDNDFEAVIQACASAPRLDEERQLSGTWITEIMISRYCELHSLGYAHSVEVWNEQNQLIGGVYGVDLSSHPGKGAFGAESMFHTESYASKLAILFLNEELKNKRGLKFLDIQTMSPHMEKMGAIEIPRNEFLKLIHSS